MQVVLLAGGFGTRFSERTSEVPKPMIEIGGKPILWHVMQIYASSGFRSFVVACGYKGEVVKEYFGNLRMKCADFTVDLGSGKMEAFRHDCPEWRVTLVDTGHSTMTGGRIKRLQPLIGNETFMVTYGDGVGNVNIRELVQFHRAHGRLATVTAVRPPARFGSLAIDEGRVTAFAEKPQSEGGWINGGFFVLEPGVFDYIDGDTVSLEQEPLELLAREGQLMAYRHDAFWHPMDTLRDHKLLERQWEEGTAPWKTW